MHLYLFYGQSKHLVASFIADGVFLKGIIKKPLRMRTIRRRNLLKQSSLESRASTQLDLNTDNIQTLIYTSPILTENNNHPKITNSTGLAEITNIHYPITKRKVGRPRLAEKALIYEIIRHSIPLL